MASDKRNGNSRLVDVIIEIPRGSRNKYKLDHRNARMRLNRVLYSSVHYPADYGLIPETLAADGEELDILVMVEEPTFPGCLVVARPIGMFTMCDNDVEDVKILSVPQADPRFDSVCTLSDVAEHWLREIENFFETYKDLESANTELLGWQDENAAWRLIEESRRLFHETNPR